MCFFGSLEDGIHETLPSMAEDAEEAASGESNMAEPSRPQSDVIADVPDPAVSQPEKTMMEEDCMDMPSEKDRLNSQESKEMLLQARLDAKEAVMQVVLKCILAKQENIFRCASLSYHTPAPPASVLDSEAESSAASHKPLAAVDSAADARSSVKEETLDRETGIGGNFSAGVSSCENDASPDLAVQVEQLATATSTCEKTQQIDSQVVAEAVSGPMTTTQSRRSPSRSKAGSKPIPPSTAAHKAGRPPVRMGKKPTTPPPKTPRSAAHFAGTPAPKAASKGGRVASQKQLKDENSMASTACTSAREQKVAGRRTVTPPRTKTVKGGGGGG
eukprot:6482849-Amphidinium_carterae.1